MAKVHGVAGEWARVRGTVFSLWPLFLSFVLLGAFLSALILGAGVWLFGGLFVATLVAVLVYWRKGLRRVESFFRGARGEERVANVLARLPETYHVFHDFVAGGSPVDHVVVGPTGVFAVETKNWRGNVGLEDGHVLVDGRLADRSPLQQAIREADAVKDELGKAGWTGTVTPVLCFASDTFEKGNASAGAAKLINAKDISAWLCSLPESVAPSELERLVQLIAAH
jgi:hypothetical protein